MGKLLLREQSAPVTPSEGVALFCTVATPSILKVKDDAGIEYSFVYLEKAQIFLNANTFAPTSVNDVPLYANSPAGTVVVTQRWALNGVSRAIVSLSTTASQFAMNGVDLGTNGGPSVIIDRNTNGSTPASGNVRITNRSGIDYYLWVDQSANLRVGTSVPTNANDLSGTVVGTQTSWIEAKEEVKRIRGTGPLLRNVLAARLYTYRMKGETKEYTGLVIDQEDREKSAWYADNLDEGQIPVLNERNLFGNLIGAIQAQQKQIEELTRRLAALEGKHGSIEPTGVHGDPDDADR